MSGNKFIKKLFYLFIRFGAALPIPGEKYRRMLFTDSQKRYAAGQWAFLRNTTEAHRYSIIIGCGDYFKSKDRKVLDIGCGEGVLQKRMDYSKYVGVDLNSKAISQAKSRENSTTRFVLSTAEEFVPDDQFDIIVFNESLYYVSDPLAVFNKYRAFLADDGIIIVSMFKSNLGKTIWEKILRTEMVELTAATISNEMSFSYIKVYANYMLCARQDPASSRAEKPKLIFFPLDLLSHYLCCLELADAVKDDIDVIVASSQNPINNQLVRDHGFSVVECKSIDPGRLINSENRLNHSWLSQDELEPVFLDQVKVIEELRPDMVISDFSITARMATEYTHTTCYALIMGHLSQYSQMRYKAARFHPAIQILEKFRCPSRLLELLTRAIDARELDAMHAGITRIRKKYQLKPRHHYFEELESEHNLVMDIEDFSPMKGLPGNFSFIGPIFHQPPETKEELLSKLDPAKQTILVNLGTFSQCKGLYEIFNDPLFRSYNIILAGNPGIPIAPEILQSSSENLSALLPRTDVFVCHGNEAAIYQSLSYGVPLLGLAYPGEQSLNLQRVSLLKLGEEIHPPLTAQQLEKKVRFWADLKKREGARFVDFAEKINMRTSSRRFRETLLHLNQRTFCAFCRQGTLEASEEIVNVPSDVRKYKNEYFTIWRCPGCKAIHSLKVLDLAGYYENYPFDQIANNFFVERAIHNLVKIARGYGMTNDSEILHNGPLDFVTAEVFRKYGLSKIDVLSRPTIPHGPWPFSDKQYDFIILVNCLDTTDDPLRFLQQIKERLKPGGRLLIQAVDAAKLDLKNLSPIITDLHQPYRIHIYSKLILLRLANSAGLDFVDYQCRSYWDTLLPFVNERAVDALDKLTDGSLDAKVDPAKLKFNRWWHLPYLLYSGLLGGVFPKRSFMLTVFERPKEK